MDREQSILLSIQSIQGQLTNQHQSIERRLARIEAALIESDTSSPSTIVTNQPPNSVTKPNRHDISLIRQELASNLTSIRNKLHYIDINQVPDEILIEIFSWVHPRQVFKFRRLSRHVNEFITTKHFATQLLKRHRLEIQKELAYEAKDIYYEDLEYEHWMVASELPKIFAQAPLNFQHVYATTFLSSRRYIRWNFATEDSNDLDQGPARIPLPTSLGCLESLQVLKLRRVRGPIPPEFSGLRSLERLILQHNQLVNIPVEIGALTSLTYLDLSYCQLNGSLPDEIGLLVSLEFLFLEVNCLEGGLPESLGNLVHLCGLQLYRNKFTGRIPASFGKMRSLSRLLISHNKLSGPLPREMLNLSQLNDCDMKNNAGLTCDFEFPCLKL
ncbi:UNVERIFIED_CONTAM: hypothetical protein HDU68_004149 [Siphonaria sp. JEL0065]|nr:hypothetical protein HDU68_004149 [Siphonaria sp. JEL0065]